MMASCGASGWGIESSSPIYEAEDASLIVYVTKRGLKPVDLLMGKQMEESTRSLSCHKRNFEVRIHSSSFGLASAANHNHRIT